MPASTRPPKKKTQATAPPPTTPADQPPRTSGFHAFVTKLMPTPTSLAFLAAALDAAKCRKNPEAAAMEALSLYVAATKTVARGHSLLEGLSIFGDDNPAKIRTWLSARREAAAKATPKTKKKTK